jgi:outer membrane protein
MEMRHLNNSRFFLMVSAFIAKAIVIVLVVLFPVHAPASTGDSDVELVAIGDADRWEQHLVTVEKEIHLLLDGEETGTRVSVRHHIVSSALPSDRLRSVLRNLLNSHPKAIWVVFDPLSAQELRASKVIVAPGAEASEVSRTILEDLRTFQGITPFSSVSVLADKSFIQGVKGFRREVERIQKELGLQVTLESVPRPGVQAVYFSPLFSIPLSKTAILIQDLNKRKVPTFSSHAAELSQEGVFAGRINDPEDPLDIRKARRVALEIQHVVLGTPRAAALSLPISYRLAINRDTARLIGVDPTFDVMRNAIILSSSGEPGISEETQESPHEIAQEAIQSNLNLAASRFNAQSVQNGVGIARAGLLPKIDLGLGYLRVNGDISQASQGLIPEHTFAGVAVISQNLFSEPVLANLSTSGHQAAASREDTRQTELDITQAALNAYAQVLLVRQRVRQQENNIARTRTNFAVARSKFTAGAGNQSDVLRWESELARYESSLQGMQANAKIAEISLNRILHRPLNRPVSIQELRLDNSEFWVSDAKLRDSFNTAGRFQALETFLVSESLQNSPELKSLDAQVAAIERGVFSDRAKFFLPTLSANALVTHTIASDAPGALGPIPGAIPIAFSAASATEWAVTGTLTYNLFNGLGDQAKLRQDAEKLQQLEVSRSSQREETEQSLRQAVQKAKAAYTSIALEQTSAKAASENYELIRRAYVRGARSITDLIDAQNNAFNAEVAASTAVYSFFQAYFNMERALGRFDLMQTEKERREFLSRLTMMEKM